MSHYTNPGRHPPSQSSQSAQSLASTQQEQQQSIPVYSNQAPSTQQEQQQVTSMYSIQAPSYQLEQQPNIPVYSNQVPSTQQEQQQIVPIYSPQASSAVFGVTANIYPETQTASLSPIQTFETPLQGNGSQPSQPLPLQRQLPAQSSTSPSSRQSSTPTRPKPIPLEKMNKAVRLWNEYCMVEMLAQQQQTTIYPGGPLEVPAPGSSASATSGNQSRARPASRSGSAYGGTTDLSSVIDFPDSEGHTSPNGRGHEGRSVYNGRIVRTRHRSQLGPVAKARAALVRHLVACSSCHSRSVKCDLNHHDIAALKRESERQGTQGLTSPIRRPHSRSQPLQRPIPTNSLISSHDTMRSASTGQIAEGGMNNLLFGIGQNDHFLRTTSPTSANDPQSPSQFPDFLAGIQALSHGQLPFTALTRAGLELDTSPPGPRDGTLFTIGIKQPQGFFSCSGSTLEGAACAQSSENPEMLQQHFEQEHFPFTRIDPAHRYVCRDCEYVSNVPVNLCLSCHQEHACETRIYGRFINTTSDHPFTTNDQSPFSPFSPNSNNYSGSGFDHQNNQNMGRDNSMGSSDGMNHGGNFNYLPNNQYQSPNTPGGNYSNQNSSRSSRSDASQFRDNQFSINGAVHGKFDYFHAKGRQKLHRHRLLATILVLSAFFALQVFTWIITKRQTVSVLDTPNVGFASVLVSFMASHAYWTIRDSISQKMSLSICHSLDIRSSKPLGCSHSSLERHLGTIISLC